MSAGQITAHDAYLNLKSGIDSNVKGTQEALKKGMVIPISKDRLAKIKSPEFQKFITDWKIPVVDAPVRSERRGKIEQAVALTGDNSLLVKTVREIRKLEIIAEEECKKVGKVFAPSFIRGTGTPRTAPAVPAPAK